MTQKAPRPGWRRLWPRFLLAIPFAAALWVPSYNRIEPELAGIPFFYWYQLAWILIGAGFVLLVYALETKLTHATETPKAPLDAAGTPGDIL